MLQAFLQGLEERWRDSDDWIFVVANSMWTGSEIDLVCVLPSAIIVADFKSHDGELTGTENGPWMANGILVKGGRKDNPFQQLRDNKFAVLNWLKSKSLLSGRNLGHISASPIFSGPIVDSLELSPNVRSWFFPTDLGNSAALLGSIASPQLKIEKKEAQIIVDRLGVRSLSWHSKRRPIHSLPPAGPSTPVAEALTSHQQEALQNLQDFLAKNELSSFSVLGMTSTGKSRLLIELARHLHETERQVIVLEPNRRLATNLSREVATIDAISIYNHLFYGAVRGDVSEQLIDDEAEERVIPIRGCDDADDCVYLVDDAHLLGNSRFATPDGKIYGTGKLLSDFFDFADFEHTNRKVVFFGDPYQIQRASIAESILSGEFQKSRGIDYQLLELSQVFDAVAGSAKLANAFKLVAALRENNFAEFVPEQSETFRVAESTDAAKEIADDYRSDPRSVWYLADTHEKANAFTRWARERLHGRKDLRALEPGDLLEIFSAPDSGPPDRDFIPTFPGTRRTVRRVGARNEYQQGLRWAKKNPVKFHSISVTLEGGNASEIEIFEEFLISEKPELDKETAVAERVLRDKRDKERREATDPTQPRFQIASKEGLPASIPGFVYARHGYATTVHHAQGMSKRRCYLNCAQAAGRHTDAFFRWIYSALTVAEEEVILLNFSDVHPLDGAEWNIASAVLTDEIPVGAGWAFEPDGKVTEADQERVPPNGLSRSDDVLKSAAIWLQLSKAAENHGWKITSVASHPYLERYELAGPDGQTCRLRISYNGKNTVTAMHVDDEEHWNLLTDLARDCLAMRAYDPAVRTIFETISSRFQLAGWKVVSVTETAYRLVLTVARDHHERILIEVNFDKQGLASSIRPLKFSQSELLDEVREALL